MILIYIILGFVSCQFFLKPTATLYKSGDTLELKVRKVSATGGLPYDFYELPYCYPTPKPVESVENLGELLFGDRIKTSVYELPVKKQITCQELSLMEKTFCPQITPKDGNRFRSFIKDGYFIQMEVDNLPAASVSSDGCKYVPFSMIKEKVNYKNVDGFDMGCYSKDLDRVYLNNHFSFNIKYHEESSGEISIIAVEVLPSSITHEKGKTCVDGQDIPSNLQMLVLKEDAGSEPVWSYSVNWQAVDQTWGSRWNNYLQGSQTNIHWYSIVNSCLIVIFLTGMIAMIMIRILHKDIARYNLIADDEEDELEDRGWKLVHGDVFRTPRMKTFFTVLIGSGVQILGMLICTLPIAALTVSNLLNVGYVFSAMILLYFLMGLPSGFFSLRFYKMFEGENWKITTLFVALFFPTIVFLNFAALNLFVKIGANSSIAIPFLQLVLIFLLWVGIYIPLVFIGGAVGYKRKTISVPCDVTRFPRLIPPQPWYLRSYFTIPLAGIMPFGAIFVEFYFVMTSVWNHKLYFMFGFIFLIFVILLIVTSEITIILVYLQLCNEEYRWWWRSFFTGGFAAVYIFLFTIYYLTTLHPSSLWTIIVYLEYMGFISGSFFVLLGTCGFISSLVFIKRIYGSIRIE